MNDIEQLLREQIQAEVESLEGLEVGSKEHQMVVDEVAKLTDRLIEFKKFEADNQDKAEKREEEQAKTKFEQNLKNEQFELEKSKFQTENDFKLKQANEDRKDRIIKNCVSVAGIVLPIWVTIWGTLKTLEFEKEGTVTTIMGRGFINKLLPRK